MNPIPDLIDNRKHQLAQVLRDLLAEAQEPTLDVVTAFFNLRGLEVLAPEIETLTRLRLLLGKEQQQEFVVGERLLAELERAVARGEATAHEIERWRNFLAQAKVEIRRYLQTFCHGKAYVVTGIPIIGDVGIVGSSNFTGAGLTTNLELNAVLKQGAAVRELQRWFDSLWEEAEDYKSKLLDLLERFTRSYTPYEIYIKVVYEALRDKLDQSLGEQEQRPSPIALANFQRDGYLAAKEILENYGGVLIADSVGLGKTYLTLRLLDDYAYRERQTALVVCPAAVMETVWRPLLQEHAIPSEIVSMEKVSQKDFPVEEYARRFSVVVVDESHNFRNPNTNRWGNLFRLISNSGPDTKVILLTATPVNNSIFDLYHQLRFITRDEQDFLLTAGIKNLQEYFKRADQSREALYEVLEALAVRRSRQFIRQNYPEATIDGRKIHFPERVLHTVRYSLKQTYGENLYRRIAQTIERLRLAPYQVEMYRRGIAAHRFEFEDDSEMESSMMEQLTKWMGWRREEAHNFMMAIGRQRALAHILRVLYLKRLESSTEALRISLHRLCRFLERFLNALQQERLLSATDYRQWIRAEAADEEEAEEANFEAFLDSLPRLDVERYDVESLCADTEADLKALQEVLSELEKGHRDDKLETLKDLLTSSELAGKKIVLFSYFRDTARYIYQQLKKDTRFLTAFGPERIAIVDSRVNLKERKDQIVRFAPRANGNPDLPPEEQIDLLISTDALSEGQNLQDGEVIINYDLHWNPVRMVQRIGRLDRLGSSHAKIFVYNFFPEQELEEILNLLKRLREKLDAINRTVGLDASILGELPNPMEFNILRRIQNEDQEVLQQLEEESDLAVGEFIRQDVLQFLKKLGESHLQRIPLGVGTVWENQKSTPGFFAAFRNPNTKLHHWLFYEFESKRIIDRNLVAIHHIRCGDSESARPLPENFDPRVYIKKLRQHLWHQIRRAEEGPATPPAIQRQIINWLRALPPSSERNRLLQYFEARAVAGPALKELHRLWRERSKWPQEQWLVRLGEFVTQHPHPPTPAGGHAARLAPEQEEDLECVAWMLVLNDSSGAWRSV